MEMIKGCRCNACFPKYKSLKLEFQMNSFVVTRTEEEQLLIEAYRRANPVLKRNILQRSTMAADASKVPFAAKARKELKRLNMKQSEVMRGTGNDSKEVLQDLMQNKSNPTFELLKYLGWAGFDVNYLITGWHQAGGIGAAAVHDSVLEAVHCLSLEVDAAQLASAVTKLS